MWAIPVALVAGEWVATAAGAVAFAGMHIPLYGWSAVPLDLAVGLVLGALRIVSRSWTAPAEELSRRHVDEAAVVALERDDDRVRRPVAVLGHDEVGFSGAG